MGLQVGHFVRLKDTGEIGRITDVREWPPPHSMVWVSVDGQTAVAFLDDEVDPIRDPTLKQRRG